MADLDQQGDGQVKCLFCQIAEGTIPANIVYRDEHVLVFDDINPQAPHHKLIIPLKHIATINDISDEDTQLMGHILKIGKKLAKELNVADDGYRVVMNCNSSAGQTVFHIHAHLLAGRQMSWPPG
jgi:histidine triad (HIT) family protein